MKIKLYNKVWERGISWKSFICIIGTILLCGFSTFQGSFPEVNEISLYAWLHYSREELLLMGEQASAYFMMVNFRDMEWFIVFLPLLAAFPTVSDFAEQWFSGYYYPSISRKTRKYYTTKWVFRAALQGFACVVCGILIYFVLVYCKFPHYEEFNLDAESSIIAMSYGTTALKRFATLFLMVFHTGLLAAIFAMSAVLLTVLCKDSFFAVSSLVLMEYFSAKLYAGYEGGLIERYYMQEQEVPVFNRILRFVFPSNHLYYDQSFSREYGIGYWFYLMFAAILIAGIWLWLYRKIRKRNE